MYTAQQCAERLVRLYGKQNALETCGHYYYLYSNKYWLDVRERVSTIPLTKLNQEGVLMSKDTDCIYCGVDCGCGCTCEHGNYKDICIECDIKVLARFVLHQHKNTFCGDLMSMCDCVHCNIARKYV